MAKKPLNVEQGVQLDKQGSARTYNERDEGLLYNNQNLGIRVQTEGADREVLTDTQTQNISNKTISLSTLVSPSINSPQISDGTFANSVLNSPTINSASINVPVLSGGNLSLTTIESSSINACTLSGSTINADTNTISNLEVDNLKSGVLLTTTVSVSINDANLFSAKAIKDYVDQQDTANSGALTNHINETVDAHDASAISSVASGNLAATDVQSALNELQSDIDTRELASNKGAVNGYCPLGADQKVPAANLPSYVDDIEEYANLAAFPVTGESGKLYLALDTSLLYRWSGSVYAEVSQSLALGETSTTAYRGDRGATAYSHSQATSGTHGITGSFVGTTDTQVITNKDIDGGVAANTRRITFPSDTLANLNALTRKEGTVVYATDTDKLYYDNGSILTAVGSGSGSGDLATYAQLKSDDDTGTWSTGNNATFLGGGSIAGTFTKQNATSPLNGTYSYTLVQAAGSLNDYIASDVQAVPLRSRGVTNSTDLVYTYDGSDNDIKWVVYDVTNATVVTPVTAYVKASSVGKTTQLVYDLPVTCTQVRFGAQVVVANSGKTLKFDDVQLSTWTPQAVNLNVQEILVASGTANGQMPFTSVSGEYGQVIGVGINSVVIKKKALIVATGLGDGSAAGNLNINWYNSSGTLLDSYVQSYPSSGAHSQSVPFTKICNVGDYLTVTSNMTLNMRLSVTASAISENVVQAWQDGMATWSATSTIQIGATTTAPTKGTTILDQVKWVKNGTEAELWYQYNQTAAGSAGSGDYLFTLPAGLRFKNDTTFTTSPSGATSWNSTNAIPAGASYATGGFQGSLYVLPYDSTRFRIGLLGGSNNSGTPVFGIFSSTLNALSNTTVQFSLRFSAPIQDWSSTPTLLALPTSKSPSESATFSNNGTITISSMSSDWITSISRSGVGTGSIDYTKLSLTKPPALFGTDLTGNGRVISFSSITTTSATWKTESNSGSAADGAFSMKLEKQSPDYTAPGVFISGGVCKEWTYDLTTTGTNWTQTRARGTVFKTGDGSYHLKFNIKGTVSSGTRTSYSITIANLTFYNGVDQAITGYSNLGGSTGHTSYAASNTGNLTIEHNSGTTTSYTFSGFVELNSKPSFATMTE